MLTGLRTMGVAIGADVSDLQSGLRQAAREVDQWAARSQGAFDRVDRGMGQAQREAASLGRSMSGAFKSAEDSARTFERELERVEQAERDLFQMQAQAEREMTADFEQRARRREEAMGRIGIAGIAVGAAITGGLGLATDAAISWESAWAGVRKTVDGSPEEMAALEEELRGLARTLPATHDEIAGVAEAAGQLGVRRQDVASFTRVMVDLGETTNLTADEAATGLARLANIMGTSTSDVERLGSALVALGNDGASTEAEILEMALRISGAGKQVGLTEADVLSFANALSSLGIESEAGGTAISRVFIKINDAVHEGGDALATFATTAGVSSAEFAAAFRGDAATATALFIDGLGRMQQAGQNTTPVLDELELADIRVSDALRRAASGGDLLTDSLTVGSRAWEENSALAEEAGKRYATAEARIQVARNEIRDAAIDIGQVLLPAVADTAGLVGDLASAFADLPAPVKTTGTLLASAAGAASLLSGAFILGAPKVTQFKASIEDMGTRSAKLSRGLVSVGNVLSGPWGLALAGGVVALGIFASQHAAAKKRVEELTRAIEADSGALAENTRTSVANSLEKAGLLTSAQKLGLSLATVTDAYLGNEAAIAAVNERLDDFNTAATAVGRGVRPLTEMERAAKALGDAIAGGNQDVDEAVAAFKRKEEATGADTDRVREAIGATAGLAGGIDELNQVVSESDQAAADWREELAKLAAGFVVPIDAYTAMLRAKEDAAKESAEAASEAQNRAVDDQIAATERAFQARIDAVDGEKGASERVARSLREQRDQTVRSLRDQKDAWEDYVDDVSVSVDDYLDELGRQVKAQRDWRTNMLLLSTRVSEVAFQVLARMGPEAAPLIADMVDATPRELARFERLARQSTEQAGLAIADEFIAAGVILEQVAEEAGQKTADGYARQLAAGKTTVAEIGAEYGIAFKDGIPEVIETRVSVSGQAHARRVIRELGAEIEGLDRVEVRIGVGRFSGKKVPLAHGGKLYGPGTGTSDSIDARLSAGEWVITERSAAMYGDAAMSAINQGRVSPSLLRAVAGGGTMTDELRRHMSMFGSIPGYRDGGQVGRGVTPPSWRSAAPQVVYVTPPTNPARNGPLVGQIVANYPAPARVGDTVQMELAAVAHSYGLDLEG